MTYVTDCQDLAALAVHLAPYVSRRALSVIAAADCYDDGELRFYGAAEDGEPLLGVVYPDGAVEAFVEGA